MASYGRQGPRGTAGSDSIEELESELERFEKSTDEFVRETRAGGGTPAERRMADAFRDLNAVFVSLDGNVDSLRVEVAELRRRIDAMDTMRGDFREITAGATALFMEDYGRSLEQLKARSERAIAAIEGLDVSIGKKYEEAVDGAVKRLRNATALAIGIMFLFFACMLAATWVWTWGEESFMPWMHNLMAERGWIAIAFWIVLTGIVLAGIAYVYSKTKKVREGNRY